ncbi:MAG TPA: response regulator [Thermoanaerobaculia bacterium]|nr:response regulator [Thermoanaerobaculia bacterium]
MAKVLIVDDDPDIVGIVRLLFETAGHQVATTLDPRRALDLAEDFPADAMVLDVMMPGMSGWEVLEEVRGSNRLQGLPVLMLSAIGDAENRTRGLRAGADDFLPKPFSHDELLARVERLIRRHTLTAGGLSGGIGRETLPDVLQTLELGKRTGRLELQQAGGAGVVLLEEGRVVTARMAGLEGWEAAFEVVSLTEGTFHFIDLPWVGPDGQSEPISVHAVLMESAWVEDELARRADSIPAADQPLLPASPTVPAPPVPEQLRGLPIAAVLRRCHQQPGTTLAALQGDGLAARRRLELAAAWLAQAGLLTTRSAGPSGPEVRAGSAAEPASKAEREEDLDAALREVFQEALYRGYPLDPLEVLVYVSETGWRSFRPLVQGMGSTRWAAPATASDLAARPRGRAAIELVHAGGRLRLRFESLPGAAPAVAIERCLAVLVWLDRDPLDDEVDRLLGNLAATAGDGTSLLVLGASASDSASPELTPFGRWQQIDDLPATWSELFAHLTTATP